MRSGSWRSCAVKRLNSSSSCLSLLKHELDEFIRLTAHDLHEPLRMVSCYVQLLERRYCGRLDSDADEFIQFAMDGARRMQAMVDGLCALSRVTSAGRPFRTA